MLVFEIEFLSTNMSGNFLHRNQILAKMEEKRFFDNNVL